MRTTLTLLLIFVTSLLSAQVQLELTSSGFAAVEQPMPERPLEDLMQIAKGWATSFNKKGADVYDVSSNSITIDAFRENAYYYINRGETYRFDIKYSLKVTFQENNTCRVMFSVKEISDHGKVLQTTLADFFAPDGRLKEDFEEVKPSLEDTASKIVRSFFSRF